MIQEALRVVGITIVILIAAVTAQVTWGIWRNRP